MKKKRNLIQYGFGGDPEDGTPRLVTAIPSDYVLDTDYKYTANPTAKVYKKVTSSTPVVTPATTPNPPRRRINYSGKSIKSRGTVRKTAPVAEPTETVDRVYMQDAPAPAVSPQSAKRGTNIFSRTPTGSNYAIGDAVFPVRKSGNKYDSGIQNSGTENVTFRYYKPGGSDLSGEELTIPFNEWNTRKGVNPTTNWVTEDFLNTYKKPKMATGGLAGVVNQTPQVVNSLIDAFDRPGYTNQPLVNAAALRNMVTPYSGMAFGGAIENLDEDEVAQVQQYADENGMSIEEAFEALSQETMGGNDEQEYAMGGLTSSKAKKILRDGTANGKRLTPKQKRYMGWIAGGKKAYGGNADVNVEGGEILEPPGQEPMQMQGPKHEEGGIDVNVPVGTKVFSERLAVDGKTMKQRKVQREKRMDKMEKLMSDGRTNMFTKNTAMRMGQISQQEEEQDMVLQKVANKIYAPPAERGYGGYPTYAGGGSVKSKGGLLPDWYMDPTAAGWNNWAITNQGSPGVGTDYVDPSVFNDSRYDDIGGPPHPVTNPVIGPSRPGHEPRYESTTPGMQLGRTGVTNAGSGSVKGTYNNSPAFAAKPPENSGGNGSIMTPGDYMGMAGGLFSSIMPLINARNAAQNTKPVINRWLGAGQRAIDANQQAMDYAQGQESTSLRDLDTSTNSAIARNRGGANSINTLRALDTATQMGKDRAAQGIRGAYANQMMGLYGQRGGLTNQQDAWQAHGQEVADEKDQMNLDNMYSSMGQAWGNLGSGIQDIGKNLNVTHGNAMDMRLLNQMGEYLGFDKDMWLENLKDLKTKSGGK